MKKWLTLALAAFMLTACGNKDNAKETVQEIEDETSVGFEIMGDDIEEAANIPNEVKIELLAAFDEYIESFNAEDIERYGNTLSANPQGFDYTEDIELAEKAFAEYDIERIASDVTIVKYTDTEAQVFANLDINMKEVKTDAELSSSGRQVTVFVKEDGTWKVTSVYYIGNEA